jgi:MFS family permease
MSLTADIPHPLARLGPRMGLYGVSIITATILGWVLGGVLVVKLGYSWLFQTVAIVLIIGAIMSIIIKELPPLIEKEEIPKISAKEAISKLRRLLKNKSYTIAVISIFAHMMTMGALVALLAPHLQILWLIEKEKAAFYAGMIFASYGISCLIFQVPMGYFSEKYGRRISLVAGLALVSVSMMALSIAPSFFLLVIIAGIYGASYSLLFPTICAMVIESARPNERALASSFFHIMFTEGVVVGAPLFAKVAHMYGYAIGLRFSCLAPLVVMVIALVLLKEKT